MGEGVQDVKEVTILGRILRWTKNGLEYEVDPKHREMILEHFGFGKDSRAEH